MDSGRLRICPCNKVKVARVKEGFRTIRFVYLLASHHILSSVVVCCCRPAESSVGKTPGSVDKVSKIQCFYTILLISVNIVPVIGLKS